MRLRWHLDNATVRHLVIQIARSLLLFPLFLGPPVAAQVLPKDSCEASILLGKTSSNVQVTSSLDFHAGIAGALSSSWILYVEVGELDGTAHTRRVTQGVQFDTTLTTKAHDLSGGAQYQLHIPESTISPYLTFGFGGLVVEGAGTTVVSVPSGSVVSPIRIASAQTVGSVGTGVRWLHSNSSRWGVRVDYRAYVPTQWSSGIVHRLSAGLFIKLNRGQ